MERRERGQKDLHQLCDLVKAQINYRSFYLRYLKDARLSGSRIQAHCPIRAHKHSGRGNPSLSVDLPRGLFHCFSRDEGGDAIRFYELMHDVSFSRAVTEMAKEFVAGTHVTKSASVVISSAPDKETLCREEQMIEPLSADAMRDVCEKFMDVCRHEDQIEGIHYLARRGINAETMLRAGVTYFPRRAYHRVMRQMLKTFTLDSLQRSGLFNSEAHLTFYRHRLLFPFYVEGQAVYLQARTTASGVEPRWHNMRGGVPALYNVDALENLPSGAVVYLVEGFTDTLTLMEHGFTAVGLVGAGGLKEEWLAPLGRFRVVAALDADSAGERAAVRYAEMFAARGIHLAQLDLPSSDVNDFFRKNPAAALEFALRTEAAIEKQNTEFRSQMPE